MRGHITNCMPLSKKKVKIKIRKFKQKYKKNRNPSGKRRQLIILHIGSKHDFVDDGSLLFEGRKMID